jgi:hypothetical protein
MTLWTFYALFGDDIRMLGTDSTADPVFFSLTIAAMAFYLVEIFLSCISKPEYLWSFYFWLDIISTVTMIMDIGWIMDPIISGGGTGAAKEAKKVSVMTR